MSTLSPLAPPPGAAPAPLPEAAAAGPAGRDAGNPIAPVRRVAPSHGEAQSRTFRPAPRDGEPGRDRAAGRNLPVALAPGADRAACGLPGASSGFLVQLLGQDVGPAGWLAGHRDGTILGSEAYRRAGGEPPLYSERPAVFRITA